MKKIITILNSIVCIIVVVVVFRGRFSETKITVVDSQGKEIQGALVASSYRCGEIFDEGSMWSKSNDIIKTDSKGVAVMPSYFGLRLSHFDLRPTNLFSGDCNKQIVVAKSGYAKYKNLCPNPNIDGLDLINSCGTKVRVSPLKSTVVLTLYRYHEAPEYDPNALNQIK